MMKYVVDLFYIIFALVTVIVFTKRGFVESVFRYGRSIVATLLAFAFGPSLGEFIYTRFVYNGVYNWVYSKLNAVLHSAADSVNIDFLIDGLPFIVKQFITPDDIRMQYGETMANIEQSAQDFAATVSSPISNVISNFIAYILVFLLALLVLLVLGKVLDLIVHLPILRTINTVLGFIIGVGAAFLFLAGITYLLSVIIGFFGDILSLRTLASTSHLFGFFDRIHLFDLF